MQSVLERLDGNELARAAAVMMKNTEQSWTPWCGSTKPSIALEEEHPHCTHNKPTDGGSHICGSHLVGWKKLESQGSCA